MDLAMEKGTFIEILNCHVTAVFSRANISFILCKYASLSKCMNAVV